MTRADRERCAADLLAGQLDAPAQAALAAELRGDPAFARELAALALIERLLRFDRSGAGEETFTREVLHRVNEHPSEPVFAEQVVRRVKRMAHEEATRPTRKAGQRGSGRTPRRRTAGGGSLPLPALLAAALLLVVVGIVFIAGRPSPAPHRSEARGTESPAQIARDLQRSEEAARRAREESARIAAERRQSEERLAGIERERQRLAEMARATEVESQEREVREREQARLDAQRKEEEARLAATQAAQRKADDEMARAEAARKEAERNVAAARPAFEEIGEVVFVGELKAGAAQPVLVRGTGERAALSKGMKIHTGDRIETSSLSGQERSAVRPVHAAVELWGGAMVDLADTTRFEALAYEQSRLLGGLLYAKVAGEGAGAARRGDGGMIFKTADVDVQAGHASFDLQADGAQTVVQIEDGRAVFSNAHGRRELSRGQRCVGRQSSAPGAVESLPAGRVWGGRAAETRNASILRFDFEDSGSIRSWIAASWSAERVRPGSKGVLKAGSLEKTEYFSHFKTGMIYRDGERPALFPVTERTRLRFAYFVSSRTSEVKIQLSVPAEERKRLGLQGAIAWKIENPRSGSWQEATGLLTEVFRHRSGKGERLQAGVMVEVLELYAGDDDGNAVEFFIDDLSIGEDRP